MDGRKDARTDERTNEITNERTNDRDVNKYSVFSVASVCLNGHSHLQLIE